ncbi:MAG: heavy metal-binding domain-containing protein [Verrucomicrobia bacterium]|nr:heavy metal-binding domain-containing protein [Verrucomicrobiota bacterium]
MEIIFSLFGWIVLLVLLVLGFGVGKYLEAQHYASIKQREAATLGVAVVTFKQLPEDRPVASATLAVGSIAVSVDYYKRFLAGFRMFFGGEMRSYSSLLDRARREAVLRMKESAPGAHLFLNCRLETSSVSKGERNTIGTVEVIAYATAVTFADEIHPQTPG